MHSFSRLGIFGVVLSLGIVSVISAADGNPFATTSSSANTNDFSFLSNGCMIPVNQSTCRPSYKGAMNQTFIFDVTIRSNTMDEALAKNSLDKFLNTKMNSFQVYVPAGNTYLTQDFAEGVMLTHGENALTLRKVSADTAGNLRDIEVLGTGKATATCTSGTKWTLQNDFNGNPLQDIPDNYLCEAAAPSGQSSVPSEFQVEDCVIQKGDSACLTNIKIKSYPGRTFTLYYKNTESGFQNDYFDASNSKFNVLWNIGVDEYNETTGYYSSRIKTDGDNIIPRLPNTWYYHPLARGLTYGNNTIELRSANKALATTTARATCVPGTIWTVFGQIDGKSQSPNNNMRGTRYCLPPFPDTPAGATMQFRKINAEEPRLDPEFGNVEGYCDPGYKWLPDKPYTYQGKVYTYYGCKISDQPVSASDVKFTVQPCVIGAENDQNSGGNVCNAFVTLDTKVNAMFAIVNTFGKDTPDVNGMIQYPFSFNNFNNRNYNIYGNNLQRRVQLQHGENTIQLRSMKQMPTALENKYIGDLITTVKITIGCAQGTRYDKVRKMCLKNDQTLAIGEDKNPEFINALTINGQDGKSKSISIVSNPGLSPNISGKIEFPTRKNYSVVGAPAINIYPVYVQVMDEGNLSLKITSDSTDYYIVIPVKADGSFNIINSTTPVNYRNAFFSSGENTLKFELLQKDGLNYADGKGGIMTVDSTLSALIVNIQVSIVNSTLPKDATPVPITGPIQVSSGETVPAKKIGTLYLRGGDAIEVADGLTEAEAITKCKEASTPTQPTGYLGCTWNGKNILSAAIGTSTTNTSPTDTDNAIVVIRDTLSPDTSSLDAASKARIDKIIARVEKRVSAMIVENALKYLDSSIARIKALPNKNAKAKLIDTYTIETLEDLRDTIAETETDYIGLIDTSLSDN